VRTKKRVCFPAAELPAGGRKLLSLGRREIVVIDSGGTLYAVKNNCPHQQAPLLAGVVGGTRLPSEPGEYVYGLDGQVLRCPWHAYEFDLSTGHCIADPDRYRVAVYDVERDGDEIVVYV
jgi:3-phenylpropionate/trans-cinnamate dioxygenase ferredoxin subunit